MLAHSISRIIGRRLWLRTRTFRLCFECCFSLLKKTEWTSLESIRLVSTVVWVSGMDSIGAGLVQCACCAPLVCSHGKPPLPAAASLLAPLFLAAGRKVDALLSRINDGPEYWLASDETLSKEDGVFAAAELIRTFFQEQPDPLLLESDALADEINTYRVGSDMTAALQEAATEVVGALQPQARACVGALARHASTVVSHRANNGTMMLGLAEAFAETTGVRAELLAFLFAHSDELELDDAPPPCTREQCVPDLRLWSPSSPLTCHIQGNALSLR